jgi:hypothetical protein
MRGGGLEPNKTTTKKRGYPFMLLPMLKTVVYHTALHWIGLLLSNIFQNSKEKFAPKYIAGG